MKFSVFTLFPSWFDGPLGDSILGRARQNGTLAINMVNFRDFATDKHKTVDDTPYGGGGGMVLRADVLAAALDETVGKPGSPGRAHVVLTSARGKIFDQTKAVEFSKRDHVAFVCGHYEGVDQRLIDSRIDEEVSIGAFVLTGGELAAMTMIDATARMIDGVLGNSESAPNDSFMTGLLEGPHYTRPDVFEGVSVPDVLISGDHGGIAQWREESSLAETRRHRPDLFQLQLLHPEQVRRLARRGKPFVLWCGPPNPAIPGAHFLYVSPRVERYPEWRSIVAQGRPEQGICEGVWFREIKEAENERDGEPTKAMRMEVDGGIAQIRTGSQSAWRGAQTLLGNLQIALNQKQKPTSRKRTKSTGESA